MAVYVFIITIPVPGLTKQINQMILYSRMLNCDKLLNRQTNKSSEFTYKILFRV